MFKKIEMIPATDPESLKEKLEEMVNDGWEIRGFVCFNCGNPTCESFAVLERISEKEIIPGKEYEAEIIPEPASPYPKTPRKKEASISIGGN